MTTGRTTIATSIELDLAPSQAFEILVRELTIALAQEGLQFEQGESGHITEGTIQVGRVISWQPGIELVLQWQPANWESEESTLVRLSFEPLAEGTRVLLEHRGWGILIGGAEELAGWFAYRVAAPFLKATTPLALGDWLTDRRARRPNGDQAREIYRDPLYHYPNFQVLLEELVLTPTDYLVEVGCGGGALLKEALKSGCRAAAIDHSVEMVQLAQEMNQQAIEEERVQIYRADAARLPFADATFTCATMTGVLGFLPDPLRVLQEIHRVLRPGGRLVMFGADPALRGTMAAPEPMASRLHFYEDDELKELAEEAGFGKAQVVRRKLEPYARQVGVPQEHLALFAGPGSPFLLAQKA
ncbi:MAG TPA: methyltransferase domain-containing protein [Ktedonobacteraceae bacterium]|nr:methyltransferase domain-containing protein [Ktedonobacteraceae bacterium]